MACGPPGKFRVLVYFAQADGIDGVQVVGEDVVLPRRVGAETVMIGAVVAGELGVETAGRELAPRGDRPGEDAEDHRRGQVAAR